MVDIRAQLLALRDPRHPKDAVWIAHRTRAPADLLCGLPAQDFPAGLLVTTRPWKLAVRAPSDDTLALILGYPESKSALARYADAAVVVRGLDDKGNVLIEMASSSHLVRLAQIAAARHGCVEITSIAAALARRQRLLQEEAA